MEAKDRGTPRFPTTAGPPGVRVPGAPSLAGCCLERLDDLPQLPNALNCCWVFFFF